MTAERTAPTGSDAPLLEVGRVARPHGLRGEVVVDLVTNRTERLAPGTVLSSDRGDLVITHTRPHQGRWLVTFEGVADRPAADALRGVVLRAPALADDEALWVHELIGAAVVGIDGRRHGRVTAVEANPASDLLVLEGGGLVPLRFVVERRTGEIVVDVPPGLLNGD